MAGEERRIEEREGLVHEGDKTRTVLWSDCAGTVRFRVGGIPVGLGEVCPDSGEAREGSEPAREVGTDCIPSWGETRRT